MGKSTLALELAEKLLASGKLTGVDLISADSRQVYKGLELLSGADEQPTNPKIKLHGVAIIQPTEEWSLAHFHHLANQVIGTAVNNNRAVIVVGGTGLYQTQLLQSALEDQAPPLLEIRNKAESMNVTELQAWLKKLDPHALDLLNESDRANSRRLIRAIERVLWQHKNPSVVAAPSTHTQEFIGLRTTKENLAQRIRQRVIQRLKLGVVNEVTRLEARLEELGTPLAKIPARSACGLREVLAFSRGEIDRSLCIELWTQRELAYAKRQDTWWKKYSAVKWFDTNQVGWQDQFFAACSGVYSR